jgi:hypothetical protein
VDELPHYLILCDKLNNFSTPYKCFKGRKTLILHNRGFILIVAFYFCQLSLILLKRENVKNFEELLISLKISGDELGVKIQCFSDLFPPPKQFHVFAGGAVL